MEQDQYTHTTIQAALTALSIQYARTDERLAAIQQSLIRHMEEEHEEFKQALQKVTALEDKVAEVHHAARFTRALIGILASIAGFFAWAADNIHWGPK